MEHIAALLLIVGCSSDYSACRELPAPTPIFETMEECKATLPLSRRDARDKSERVLADCVFVDPAMEEDDTTLAWNVTRDGRLVAEIIAAGEEMLVASSGPPDELSASGHSSAPFARRARRAGGDNGRACHEAGQTKRREQA